MKPELQMPEDYVVPECTLPEGAPMRRQGVIMTRVANGWDIRIALPIHLTLSDDALNGQPIAERAEEIAKNIGVMMTNDLWLEIVPLVKETLSNAP
jgi:hypothetical protein